MLINFVKIVDNEGFLWLKLKNNNNNKEEEFQIWLEVYKSRK